MLRLDAIALRIEIEARGLRERRAECRREQRKDGVPHLLILLQRRRSHGPHERVGEALDADSRTLITR